MHRRIIARFLLISSLIQSLGWMHFGALSLPGLLSPGLIVDGYYRAGPREAQPLASIAGSFPPVTRPDPVVQGMLAQVDPATMYGYAAALTGQLPAVIDGLPYTIDTRYTLGNASIKKAAQYVGEHLVRHGLMLEYQRWGTQADAPPNVIGELQGEESPGDIYMLVAHLDDRPSFGAAPGADDNASGAAGVMIASDVLSRHRWNCTLRFAFLVGNEQGLIGSERYAARSKARGENILGVLNLDQIGWNTGAPNTDLHAYEGLPASAGLATQIASVIETYGIDLVPEILVEGYRLSDEASFWDQGYAAVLGTEDSFPDGHDANPYYHTVNDTLDKLNPEYFSEFVRTAVAATAHMAACRRPGPSVGAVSTEEGVELIWQSVASDAAYEVHFDEAPCFVSSPATLAGTISPPFAESVTYLDPHNESHDRLENHYYEVRAMNTLGQGASSNRTGEFNFGMVPGGN